MVECLPSKQVVKGSSPLSLSILLSSNGRTLGFGPSNRSSNLCERAILCGIMKYG